MTAASNDAELIQLARAEAWRQGFDAGVKAKDHLAAAEFIDILNYVADMTYCGADAEWHFKPGYDPQLVLNALNRAAI